MILVSKQDGCVIKEKKMHLICLISHRDAGKKQPEPKRFTSQYFPCRETKKKENKRNRIIELQRNEMFEQKIISLTCSL